MFLLDEDDDKDDEDDENDENDDDDKEGEKSQRNLILVFGSILSAGIRPTP